MASRRWIAVTAGGVLLAWAGVASAQGPSMVIEGRNLAGVPEAVLAEAGAHVRAIYQSAGVSASWVDEVVLERGGSLILTVIIAHGTTGKPVLPEEFGLAPEPSVGCGHIAYVFWDRIAEYAFRNRVDAAIVLASVIAHETGHLLLPQHSHAPTGVMSAHWRTNDFIYFKRGKIIGFTEAEIARVHDQILNQCRAGVE